MSGFLSRLQRYDFNVKVDDKVQLRTLSGAVLSIASILVMGGLLVSEFLYYQKMHVREVLRVDNELGSGKLDISFHFTFPSLKCDFLNVDTEDQQGNTQIGVNLDVYKTPMDWERHVEDASGTGCDVAGNFRIALGHAKQHKHSGHAHTVYQFNMDDLRNFNSSHIIHHLAFGAPFPGMHNGLDGVEKVVKGVAQFKYYLKIVPTQHRSAGGSVVESNQYTFTEYFQDVHLDAGSFPHPGVFIKYEFAPVKVHIEEYHRSFLQFFTSVCAIVGGVFTVAGMLDGVVFTSQQALKKLA